MADKNKLSGLLMEGTLIEGKLTFKDKMRIEGEIIGEIHSNDQLIIGKAARIVGDVKVKHVIVMGYLEGSISECDLLEIHETGVVKADIHYKDMDMRPGGIFEGRATQIRQAN